MSYARLDIMSYAREEELELEAELELLDAKIKEIEKYPDEFTDEFVDYVMTQKNKIEDRLYEIENRNNWREENE